MSSLVENNLNKIRSFAGDVRVVRYRIYGLLFSFIGIVISIKRKFFFNASSVTFRNVMSKIGVELSLPTTLMYHWEEHSHAKKAFKYTKSKLLYLRSKKNKKSLIKPF